MPARRALALLLCAPLLVAACASESDDAGGDDGPAPEPAELTSEEQAFADAWATQLSEDDGEGLIVEPDEADCMGAAIMAEVGTGPFDEAGVEPDDITGSDSSPGELLGDGAISEGQAGAILETWEGCVDLGALLASEAVAEFGLDAEGEACVADGLAEEGLVRSAFVASFTTAEGEPPTEVLTALVSLIDECGSDEDGGGPLVDGIAESILEDSDLSEEEARCVAAAVIDELGADRLVELGAGGGAFDDADPEVQQEVAGAVLSAANACDVPLSALRG